MSSPAAIAALLLSIATFLADGVASAAQEGEAIRAVPASRQANTVAVLPIVGEIDQITLRSLERRLREASRLGAGAVVLEIDTPAARCSRPSTSAI